MFKKIIPAILVALMWGSPASADINNYLDTTGGHVSIVLIGDFTAQDDHRGFEDLVKKNHPEYILFRSRGGNISSAMEYGRIIRKNKLTTVAFVDNNLQCESACFYAFMGGVVRIANAGAIGIHQASLPDDKKYSKPEIIKATQKVASDIIGYLDEMGAHPSIAKLVLSIPPDDIEYFDDVEMVAARITTGIFTDAGKK